MQRRDLWRAEWRWTGGGTPCSSCGDCCTWAESNILSRCASLHYLFPRAAAFVAQQLQRKLTDRAGQFMVAKQVGLDMFVVHPFMFFPLFYQLKAFVEGTSANEALQRCWRNWGGDLRALWLLWIPAQTFNFAFCPVWARIPFVAVVSTLYTVILSTMRGSPDSDK